MKSNPHSNLPTASGKSPWRIEVNGTQEKQNSCKNSWFWMKHDEQVYICIICHSDYHSWFSFRSLNFLRLKRYLYICKFPGRKRIVKFTELGQKWLTMLIFSFLFFSSVLFSSSHLLTFSSLLLSSHLPFSFVQIKFNQSVCSHFILHIKCIKFVLE